MVSYGVSWSGSSPVGSIVIEASNDYALEPNGTILNAGTWSVLTLSVNGSPATSVAVSGNTGSGMIDITQCASYAIRMKYIPTSGTGTLQAIINGKVA